MLYINRASTDFNTVKVYSILGTKILETKLENNNAIGKVDVSSLNAGLYFIEVNNGKQKAVKKILIAK